MLKWGKECLPDKLSTSLSPLLRDISFHIPYALCLSTDTFFSNFPKNIITIIYWIHCLFVCMYIILVRSVPKVDLWLTHLCIYFSLSLCAQTVHFHYFFFFLFVWSVYFYPLPFIYWFTKAIASHYQFSSKICSVFHSFKKYRFVILIRSSNLCLMTTIDDD